MDVADLVHAPALGRAARRHRWLHFVLLGSLLFAGTRWGREQTPARVVSVPETRLRAATSELARTLGRPPTAAELQQTVQSLADQEVLLAYAVDLGLDREPVAERRLAQIAQFLTENPIREDEERLSPAETAAELGLRQQDLVTRRLLIDGARRLIRAAALLHEPTDEMLSEYLGAHPDEFKAPGETQITQIPFQGAEGETRARALLERLRKEAIQPEAATELGDAGVIPNALPALTERDLERRLGRRFVKQLRDVPAGVWSGPLASRSGLHLVYVQERREARVPPLEQVRAQVRARVRQKQADEWLALRLESLRQQYAVVLPAMPEANTP